MPGVLNDSDRIFTNLYGSHDWGLEGARRRGVWNGVRDMLAQDPAWIIDQVRQSGLRGRGGAGAATAMKWDFVAKARADRPRYLIVNADESYTAA